MDTSSRLSRRVFISALGLILALAAPRNALAQNVLTWGTPQLITGSSDVVNTGTEFGAFTAYSSNLVVNGVTFYTLANATNFSATSAGNASDFGGFSSGDTTYDHLINSAVFTPADGSARSLTINNLVVGHSYTVQLFTPAWDADWPTKYTSGANTVDMGNTASAPTYVSGTFTATSTSLTIAYQSTTGFYGMLAAASVRDVSAVPEPSTYATLAGAAGLIATAVVRRRRQV